MKSILKKFQDKDKPKLELDNTQSRRSSYLLASPYLYPQTTKNSFQRNKLEDQARGKLTLSPKSISIRTRRQSLKLTRLYTRIRDLSAPSSPKKLKNSFELADSKSKAPQDSNLLEKSEEAMTRIRKMSRNKDHTAVIIKNEVDKSTKRLVGSRGNKDWTSIKEFKPTNNQNSSLENIKASTHITPTYKKHKQLHPRKLSLEEKLSQLDSPLSNNLKQPSVFNWSEVHDTYKINVYDENSRPEPAEARNSEKRPNTNSSFRRRAINPSLSEISYADSTEYLGTAGHSLLLKIISDEKKSIPTTAREKKSLGKIILRNKQILNRLSEEDRWKDEQFDFVSAKVYNIQNHASVLIETYFPCNKEKDN